MKSRWDDKHATETIERYGERGIAEDLALRVYTTRLLGSNPRLVLHGGGNTSVKSRTRDVTGEEVDVLYVKGSGWDMGTIEPAGLPAVQLGPLLGLAALESLSDEEMVNVQRRNLLDATAPNPSVETLLHAWVPHRFIDHTHADAALVLTDQPDGEALCRDVFGDRLAIVPYIMPGFALAKKAKEVAEAHPEAEGLVLLKHGVFTFGDTAREAYERMIELVTLAEERIESDRSRAFASIDTTAADTAPHEIAPIIRGLLANPGDGAFEEPQRFVLEHRTSPEILAYLTHPELARYSQVGTVTPDHAIRTKPWPVVLPTPTRDDLGGWSAASRSAVDSYRRAYEAYFARHNPRHDGAKRMLDTSPRVALVPGVGLFASGRDATGACAAADLAETTIAVVSAAEEMSRFESISEADLFDIEYWSLEQAKLAGARERPLARHVVAITGGAGAIGRATALAFREAGAEIALLDLGGGDLDRAEHELESVGFACDVTSDESVREGFAGDVSRFGGLDIVVSNAGAAWQGAMADVADETLRASFELNFFAHQRVAREAVRIMRLQGTGGSLLFNVSKQSVSPGRDFGPYGLPKTAALGLVRQYAIEHGRDDIRSNGINADRIRSGVLTEEMVTARSAARGVSEDDYMSGNLLGREVLASDVGQAFVALALARATTGAILTVDGGNIAAALR
ncbi:MAG: bifunctional aldolase/short-chain dehydrogenase [Gemmatimonadetes bacterium]|nr:bifunctional aldolase/short-chain dehydrogenase [Gemmatimonadota bacterium]